MTEIIIGHFGDDFYRPDDQTNSVKALNETSWPSMPICFPLQCRVIIVQSNQMPTSVGTHFAVMQLPSWHHYPPSSPTRPGKLSTWQHCKWTAGLWLTVTEITIVISVTVGQSLMCQLLERLQITPSYFNDLDISMMTLSSVQCKLSLQCEHASVMQSHWRYTEVSSQT